MKYIVIGFILLVVTNLSYGAHIQLQSGTENTVCKDIFKLRLSNTTKNFSEAINLIADENGIPKWEEGLLLINPKYKEKSASFDIDNDGIDESVSSLFTWLSGNPGEYYRVIEQDKLKAFNRITERDLYSLPGLYSNTPWPYRDLGLFFFSITPFKFKGTFYLGLKDNNFGKEKFMERSFLIVKYSNEMFDFGQNNYIKTSNVDVICKFVYANQS